ncbi:hypothetical protein Esti_005973 [Eimeria stiedai]
MTLSACKDHHDRVSQQIARVNERLQLIRWFQQELELLNSCARSQWSSSQEASAACEKKTGRPKVDVKKLFQEAKLLEAGLSLLEVEKYNPYKGVLRKASLRVMQDHRMVGALHSNFRLTCSHLFPDLDAAEEDEQQYVSKSITRRLLMTLDEDLSSSRSLVKDLQKQERRVAGKAHRRRG